MKDFYHVSQIRFIRKLLVYILFLFCLAVAGLSNASAQSPTVRSFGFLKSGVLAEESVNGNYTAGNPDIDLTDSPLINFNSSITINNPSGISLRKADGTVVPITISLGDDFIPPATIRSTDSRVRITPTGGLESNTTYYVLIQNNAIRDASSGDGFIGFFTSTAFRFTANDTDSPVVTMTNPTNGSMTHPVDDDITITFNEEIQSSDVTDVNLYQVIPGNPPAAVTSVRSISGSVFTINPVSSLLAGSQYYVQYDPGAIRDLSGNASAGMTSSDLSFTTAVPSNSQPTDITLTFGNSFDENQRDVTEGLTGLTTTDPDVGDTHTYSLVSGPGDTHNNDFEIVGNILRSKAPFDFETQSQYFIRIQTDDGNGGTYSEAFTINVNNIVDETSPVVSSRTPSDGASNVSLSANLVLNFNETVSFENDEGTFELRTVSPDALVESFGFGQVSPGTGSTITINPSSNLLPNTDYYVLIGGDGVFVDGSENFFAGFNDPTDWNFSTSAPADVTPPNYFSAQNNPLDNAVDVPIEIDITMNFNENIVIANASGIQLTKLAGFVDIPITSSVSGSQLTISPDSDLENGTSYFVSITNDAIEDESGNRFGGISNQNSFNFATVNETIPPTIASFSPVDNATDVSTQPTILITFSEDVTLAQAIGVKLRKVSDDGEQPITRTIINGNQLRIQRNGGQLESGTEYYVTVLNNAIDDLAGNAFAGWSDTDKSTYNFTTAAAADNTPPTITAFNPVDNATNVPVDGTFQFTFSEPVQAGLGSANLVPSVGSVVESFQATSSRVTISGNTLTIDPTEDLDFNTEYHFTFPNGYVRDLAGNDLAGFSNNTTYNFRTEADNVAPVIVSRNPSDNDTDVSVDSDIIITFDEPIQLIDASTIFLFGPGSTIISKTVSVSGTVLTISPNSDLNASSTYFITIGNGDIADLAGNAFSGFSGPTAYNFTTAAPVDNTAPTAISFNPEDDVINVATNPTLEITFDEDIQLSGSLGLRLFSGGLLVQQFLSNSGLLSINGPTLTISPSQTLVEGTNYHVEIESGFIEDLAGNPYAGFENSTTWNFIVGKRNQTITFNNIGGRPFSPDPFQLTATSDSGLPIGYTVTAGNATVNDDMLTLTGVGNVTVRADQAGNSEYSAAAPKFQTFNVVKANQTITFDPLANRDLGSAPFDLTATASSGLTVAYTSSNSSVATVVGNTVTIQGVGSTTITASQSGNANYNAATNRTQNLVVTSTDVTAPTVVEFTPGHNTTDVDISIGTLTVTFTEPVFAGTFGSFSLRGGVGVDNLIKRWNFNTGTDISINNEVVTLSNVPALEEGAFYYVQFNPGNAVNPALSDASNNMVAGWSTTNVWSFRTEKADQTISFSALTDRTFGDSNFNLSATSSSGLIVTFSSSNSSVATISGNTVTIRGAGTTTITASQSGNTIFNAAPDVQQVLTVNKANQTISFVTPSLRSYGGNDFSLNATATSGLPVSFSSSDSDVITVSGNTGDIINAGDVNIIASQVGNANYEPATNVVRMVTVEKAVLNAFADNKTRVFGEANPAFTISYSNFVTGDDVSDLDVAPTASTSATPASDVGDYPIELTGGSDNNYTFNLTDGNLRITQASQSITFDPIPDKTFGDAPFLVNATASSGLPVEFDVISGPATIDDNEVTITGAGNVIIGAQQSGNLNYNAASATNRSFTVAKADQTINIIPIPGKLITDAPFSVSATASSGLTVSFSVSSGPATMSGNTVTLDGVSGTVVLNVFQTGNANYNSIFTTTSFTVSDPALLDQTITFDAIPDKIFGDVPFNLSATASSGLDVAFSIVSGPVTLDDDEVTITGAGTVEIAANQAGDATYNPAPEVIRSFTISKADQIITFDAIPDKTFGDAPFNLSATTSSGLDVVFSIVSGPITLDDDEVTITGAGTVEIAANQAGNENYNAASEVVRTFMVDKADQIITIDPISDKVVTDVPFDVVATTTSGLTLDYDVSGPATISGSTITLDGTQGTVTVTVEQAGNENYNAASATETFEVTDPTKQDQTITFDAIADKTFGDAPFTLSATASSGLAVAFSIVSGPINLNGNEVTITGAGTVEIAANQAGDADFNVAPEVTQSFVINKADQTITIDAITDKLTTDASFDVVASTTSGLTLNYSVSGPASISGTTVTLDGTPGTITVTVEQAGNENYNSGSATESFEVTEEQALSISDEIKLTVYPNPTTSRIYIDSDRGSVVLSWMITDLNGAIIKKGERIEKSGLDLGEVNEGVYFLRLNTREGKQDVRFIKR